MSVTGISTVMVMWMEPTQEYLRKILAVANLATPALFAKWERGVCIPKTWNYF
jgi:hypothetical protein